MAATSAPRRRQPVESEYFSLRELAVYSGLCVRTLHKHLTDADHPIPHFRVGAKILVKRNEFDAWMLLFRAQRPADQPSVRDMVDDLMTSLG